MPGITRIAVGGVGQSYLPISDKAEAVTIATPSVRVFTPTHTRSIKIERPNRVFKK